MSETPSPRVVARKRERADRAFQIGCEIVRAGGRPSVLAIMRRMGYRAQGSGVLADIRRDLENTGRWPITREMAEAALRPAKPADEPTVIVCHSPGYFDPDEGVSQADRDMETLARIQRLAGELSPAARQLLKSWL